MWSQFLSIWLWNPTITSSTKSFWKHPQILRRNSCSHGGCRSWVPCEGFFSKSGCMRLGPSHKTLRKIPVGPSVIWPAWRNPPSTLNPRDKHTLWTWSSCFIKWQIVQHVWSGRNYFKLYLELIISLSLRLAHTIRLAWNLEAVTIRKHLAVERIMYYLYSWRL